MELDPVLLARIQFALTIGFHFIFPPISIGLAWLLVIMEWRGWHGDADFATMGRFFGKLLGITFVLGVATGIVMEFQFGTNWAAYSKFVGDVFGAPLAAEGIFAFFLESAFMGLYLFGRDRISKRRHWFSILMVAVGATISAFWILVANSWQQTPAGFVLRNGRAELASFWQAVFNPSTLPRFFHTLNASLICGAFLVAGIAAYLLLKNTHSAPARKTLRLALIFGLIVSLLELFPFGHYHARQVARTQPEKLAAMEGLYDSTTGAPMILFGIPMNDPPRIALPIEIPGMLSFMAFGDFNAKVQGINDFPPYERPPLFLTFVSFHNMVALGMAFIGMTAFGVFLLWRRTLWNHRWFMKILILAIPLPVAACELGWITAEVGRQPWVVYRIMRTADAVSKTVSAGEVLFSIILFSLIYVLLGSLYLYLMVRHVRRGPDSAERMEVSA